MDDERVVEPQRVEAVRCRDRITDEVMMTPRGILVVGPTVDLEDEPITEHEVDPADARDLDLRPEPEIRAVEAQAEQGFQPALGIGSARGQRASAPTP